MEERCWDIIFKIAAALDWCNTMRGSPVNKIAELTRVWLQIHKWQEKKSPNDLIVKLKHSYMEAQKKQHMGEDSRVLCKAIDLHCVSVTGYSEYKWPDTSLKCGLPATYTTVLHKVHTH